jgi:hypothetical protein
MIDPIETRAGASVMPAAFTTPPALIWGDSDGAFMLKETKKSGEPLSNTRACQVPKRDVGVLVMVSLPPVKQKVPDWLVQLLPVRIAPSGATQSFVM